MGPRSSLVTRCYLPENVGSSLRDTRPLNFLQAAHSLATPESLSFLQTADHTSYTKVPRVTEGLPEGLNEPRCCFHEKTIFTSNTQEKSLMKPEQTEGSLCLPQLNFSVI